MNAKTNVVVVSIVVLAMVAGAASTYFTFPRIFQTNAAANSGPVTYTGCSGNPCSPISERFTTINGSTFVIISNSTTVSVACIVQVPPPQGIYLRVITDAAGTPVSGLKVTSQFEANASCDRNTGRLLRPVHLTNSVEITNSSGWILFHQGYLWYFVLTYSGQVYNFTVPSGPLSWSVATISVPSGKISTEICGLGGGSPGSCEAASTKQTGPAIEYLTVTTTVTNSGGTTTTVTPCLTTVSVTVTLTPASASTTVTRTETSTATAYAYTTTVTDTQCKTVIVTTTTTQTT